ncbi:molybdopterin-dependent oxidoreductase [Deinococcus cavernae]|nr:molybdopterin-dependent oxidoreductase [Deinococcus cavernae]
MSLSSQATSEKAPGQRFLNESMPRYGLPKWIDLPSDPTLSIFGATTLPHLLTQQDLRKLPLTAVNADFHCVTTWSVPDLHWHGWAFADVWQDFIAEFADPAVSHVRFSALDGYAVTIPLEELLKEGVLIATHLSHEPLTVKHGAPLRLVLPQLYGYKSLKHLYRLELLTRPIPSSATSRILIHPRGRVDLEERSSTGLPLFWRTLYRWQLPNFLRQAAGWQERDRETAS